jgi:hypothetical protein
MDYHTCKVNFVFQNENRARKEKYECQLEKRKPALKAN